MIFLGVVVAVIGALLRNSLLVYLGLFLILVGILFAASGHVAY